MGLRGWALDLDCESQPQDPNIKIYRIQKSKSNWPEVRLDSVNDSVNLLPEFTKYRIRGGGGGERGERGGGGEGGRGGGDGGGHWNSLQFLRNCKDFARNCTNFKNQWDSF